MRALTLIRAGATALLALCLSGAPAGAQTSPTRAIVIDTCGAFTLPLNDPAAIYQDKTGRLCINPAVDTVVQGAAVYRGGTITTAGVSQQLLAANPARRGFSVQNQSTGELYIKIGGAAATANNLSLRIAPGASYETPPHHVSPGAVAIVGGTAGQAFYATEY